MKKLLSLLLAAVTAAGLLVFSACTPKDDETIQIYMPDGAPALSMAQLMAEDSETDDTEYHVVASDAIKNYVTGNAPEADLCVLPVNLASQLLGSGEEYKMLGAVTHGNLYLLSTDSSVTFDKAEDLEGLKGKKVGVIQMANVPGLTFKVILNRYNVEWQELTGDVELSDSAVNLQAIADPATGVTPAGGCDYYIAAEPLVSAKTAATSLEVVGDLQALYGGEQGYVQAVLVAKSSLVAEKKEWVNEFMTRMSAASEWVQTADAQTVVSAVTAHLTEGLTPAFSANNLSQTVVSRCSVRFTAASECKEETVGFLNELAVVSPAFVSAVSDSFFYDAGV